MFVCGRVKVYAGMCMLMHGSVRVCVSMGTHTKIVKRSQHFIGQIVFHWQVLTTVSS